MSEIPGQGSFEFEPNQPVTQPSPEILDIDLFKRFATSSLIKYIAEARALNEAEVSPEWVQFVSPATIEPGLYLPKGKTDRDIDTAKGPVIFPAAEYKVLTKSPIHVANTASAGVKVARYDATDKEEVDKVAKRAAGHALENQIDRTNTLVCSLKDKEDALKLIEKEIFSAGGTGFYAHFKAEKMLPLISLAESAIFDTLNVSATTGGWTEWQYEEAKKALNYQLFGLHGKRYESWKQYAPMARRYAHKRRLVVQSTIAPLVREFSKYQSFLERQETASE